MSIWSYIGITLVIYLAWRFINQVGKDLPVLELLLLIAGLQWIIGPINSYNSSVHHYKYYMYVPEDTYMSYVVPALLIFSLFLLFKKRNISIIQDEVLMNYSRYGKFLLLIGILSDILSLFVPPSLKFFFFLLSQFKFVGAGLLIFSQSRRDRYFFYGALLYLVISSLGDALFHDLLLWGIFLFMLWALKNKPSLKVKLGFICAGIFLGVAIQMVKAPFREVVWGGYSGDKFGLFIDIMEDRLESGYLNDESNQDYLNVRLNQGWIISAIMKEVPEDKPFANGATVEEAITASLLPRFLSPDKKKAGGQDNFENYTGIELGENTSMGMSIIGEAYANFGSMGGIFFMLIWGFFLSVYWNRIMAISENHPVLIFFIPILFFQVVKAETELVVVLNHLVKASIVVALFFWGARKQLKWEI